MEDGEVDPLAVADDATRRPGIWSGFGTVAMYFVLQLLVGSILVAVVVAAMVAWRLIVPGPHQHVLGAALASVTSGENSKAALTAATILVVAPILGWIVHRLWAPLWYIPRLPGFGITRPASLWWLLWGVLIGIAAVLAGGGLTTLFAHGQPIDQNVAVMGRNVDLVVRLWLVVAAVGVAPIVEELIFRGVLLSGFARRMPVVWAAIGSAVVFGGVHLPDFRHWVWYPIPALILLGLVLAWLRLRSGSLWPSVLAHATNNAVAAIGWFVVTHPHP